MIKLERPPGIILRYNWKLINIKRNVVTLSKNIKYQEKDSFRIGLKNVSLNASPTLLFLTTNLNKIGLKATGVSFSSAYDPKMKPMKCHAGRKEDVNGAIQLFFATLQPVGRSCSFVFTVYLSGIVEDYRIQQMDFLLSKQLMLSDQHCSDFVLIARNGNSFSVHKWILAARSPVFAALLEEDERKLRHHIDCTVYEMNQFINFIYTGEFEEPVNGELNRLAVQYKIKTLQDLSLAASQDISADKIASLAFVLKPGSKQCKVETSKPDSNLETIVHEGNTSTFKITWKVDRWTKRNQKEKRKNIVRSEAFKHGQHKVFRAELKMWVENSLYPDDQTFLVRFLSFGHEKINCSTEEVTCSISQDDNSNSTEQLIMKEKPTRNKKQLQLFTIPSSDLSNPLSCPFVVTFTVKLRSTVVNFMDKPVDSTCNVQLWAAAVNRKMTDVEFLVGEEAYCAHRSLLSARSPVLAAMFASGMKEAETGQVCIEDIDPITFKIFLKFLYTGMLESASMGRELFEVADKYQIETLMELCRPATETVDVDDVLKTFLSC